MASVKVSITLGDECQQATMYFHDEDFYKMLHKVQVTEKEIDGVPTTVHITRIDALYLLANTILFTGLTSEADGLEEPLYDSNSIRR